MAVARAMVQDAKMSDVSVTTCQTSGTVADQDTSVAHRRGKRMRSEEVCAQKVPKLRDKWK